MKRLVYIALFSFLGVLLATLLHALIEFPLLAYMADLSDLGGENWFSMHWWTLHSIAGKVLWLSGAILGSMAGKKFWRILYVEMRYGTPRW